MIKKILKARICLMLSLVFLLTGCFSSKSSVGVTSNTTSNTTTTLVSNSNSASETSIKNLSQAQSEMAKKFIEKLGYKITTNSGVAFEVLLPMNFTSEKDENGIGQFLYEKNQQSQEYELDFSSYMGEKVYLYGYELLEKDIRKGFMIMLFDDDKMIGAWIDKSSKEADLNFLKNNLEQSLNISD